MGVQQAWSFLVNSRLDEPSHDSIRKEYGDALRNAGNVTRGAARSTPVTRAVREYDGELSHGAEERGIVECGSVVACG